MKRARDMWYTRVPEFLDLPGRCLMQFSTLHMDLPGDHVNPAASLL